MIKVKGFSSDNADSLARQITNFTKELYDSQLIDVKYQMVMNSCDTFLSTRVSALVIYKEV